MGAFDGIDEEKLAKMAEKIDVEDGIRLLTIIKQSYLDPQLVSIRDRAANDDDPKDVRTRLEQLSEEEKADVMYGVLDDLILVLGQIRERLHTDPESVPIDELAAMIRDPYTVESLLLVLDDPRVDQEYVTEVKDFISEIVRLVGVITLPELYSEDEIEAVVRRTKQDPDALRDQVDGV